MRPPIQKWIYFHVPVGFLRISYRHEEDHMFDLDKPNSIPLIGYDPVDVTCWISKIVLRFSSGMPESVSAIEASITDSFVANFCSEILENLLRKKNLTYSVIVEQSYWRLLAFFNFWVVSKLILLGKVLIEVVSDPTGLIQDGGERPWSWRSLLICFWLEIKDELLPEKGISGEYIEIFPHFFLRIAGRPKRGRSVESIFPPLRVITHLLDRLLIHRVRRRKI